MLIKISDADFQKSCLVEFFRMVIEHVNKTIKLSKDLFYQVQRHLLLEIVFAEKAFQRVSASYSFFHTIKFQLHIKKKDKTQKKSD